MPGETTVLQSGVVCVVGGELSDRLLPESGGKWLLLRLATGWVCQGSVFGSMLFHVTMCDLQVWMCTLV